MTPRPLHEIRLRWSDHKHALSWLALLYRKPKEFREALRTGTRLQQLKAGLRLMIHALPYEVLLCILVRGLLFGALRLPIQEPITNLDSSLAAHSVWMAGGIVLGGGSGVALGIFFGITKWLEERLAAGISVGLAFGIAFGIQSGIDAGIVGWITLKLVGGIANGVAFGITSGIAFGIAFKTLQSNAEEFVAGWIAVGIALGTALGITFGIAFGSRNGIAVGIALGIAFGIASLRYYYNPISLFLLWPKVWPNWYPFHPVAWDDCCSVPFWGLDRLLAAYVEQDPAAGNAEIERLIDRYPSQRTAALRAGTRLLAREAGRVTDLTRISEIVASLPQGTEGFLAETKDIGEMAGEIALIQTRLNAMDRPVFRETYAQALCTAVENFRHRVAGFHEPLASEFRSAAERWRGIAERQRGEARRGASREPTVQVFRAGDPVNRDREAFVPRDRVVARLEQQVMLATGCPGVVLYGRRRMGKSTVLKNLSGFLPPNVRVALVSMQEVEAFTSLSTFCELLGSRIREALPGQAPSGGPPGDLPGLSRLLADFNRALADRGQRMILAVDEYENIDRKIGDKVFSEDLLALVRESIQSHRNLTWVFAGSHGIEELTAVPWKWYLVSARTIEVPPFTEDETRILLTEPLKHSSLWPSNRERPHFSPAFWGNGGIASIHSQAGGWPNLVQLIAETIVDLLNESGQPQVNPTLWEAALDGAVVRGHNAFSELLVRESQIEGEMAYLQGFRTQETQPPRGSRRGSVTDPSTPHRQRR